jgi:hypothetical protein
VPGATQAGARRTKPHILTTNYEPKSPLRRTGDQSDPKSSLFEVPFSQASMTLLNIRFGFQSEQAASITAIGWGLVAEAYANYGSIAVVAVGLIIGTFTGLLTRWSDGASTLSAPTLVTIAAMMLLINVEEDFSYLFTNLFQSCVSILIFFVAFNSLNGMQKTTIRRRAPVS